MFFKSAKIGRWMLSNIDPLQLRNEQKSSVFKRRKRWFPVQFNMKPVRSRSSLEKQRFWQHIYVEKQGEKNLKKNLVSRNKNHNNLYLWLFPKLSPNCVAAL